MELLLIMHADGFVGAALMARTALALVVLPIAASGSIPTAAGTELLKTLSREGESFVLQWNRVGVVVTPTAEDRCAWAKAEGSPESAAFCSRPADAPLLRFEGRRFDPLVVPGPSG